VRFWAIDDSWNERYGHYVLQSLSSARRLSEWVVKTIQPYLGDTLLEIGSGTANISRQLPRRLRLTVSDRDPEYLHLLRGAFKTTSPWTCGSWIWSPTRTSGSCRGPTTRCCA